MSTKAQRLNRRMKAQIAVQGKKYNTVGEYVMAHHIATKYGHVLEPDDFVNGTIDGMHPYDWAAAMFDE